MNDSSAWTADVYLSRDLIKQLNADGWTNTLLLDAQPRPPLHQHQCVRVSFAAVTFFAVANAVRHALEPDSKSARQISYAALHRFSDYKDKRQVREQRPQACTTRLQAAGAGGAADETAPRNGRVARAAGCTTKTRC